MVSLIIQLNCYLLESYQWIEVCIIKTQEGKWQMKYNEVMEFVKREHWNLPKHRIEEHLILNWIKHNRKILNAGAMKKERVEVFNNPLVIMEGYKCKNLY